MFLIISELTNNPTMPGGGASNLGKYLMKKTRLELKLVNGQNSAHQV